MELTVRSLSLGRKVFYVVIILLAVPLAYLFIARDMRFFRVPSNSMEPTIHVSDYLMTLSEDRYERGDIVVLLDPLLPGGYIVKRIIGVGGDVIEVRGGAVLLNGSYASEPYRLEPIDYTLAKYRVKDDEVFVLGENSNWSVDSHDWSAGDDDGVASPGGIREDLIVGKVRYIYLPFSRMRKVESYPLRSIEGS